MTAFLIQDLYINYIYQLLKIFKYSLNF